MFAVDQQGDYTNLVHFEVVQTTKDLYLITLTLDEEWASKANYPVTIDPSIQLPNNGYIRDTYLKEGSSTSYTGSSLIYSGEYSFTDYLGYLDFTVPTYLNDYKVIYATLSLSRYDGTSTLYLHELNSYYGDFSTLTWDNKPAPSNELIDFAYFNVSKAKYQLDITNSVDKWNQLGLTEMPGFELSTNGGRVRAYSINSTVNSPTIEIGFIDSNGIKDYWTYNSQEVGKVGTGLVSDYTGFLTFIRNDINFTTDKQSLGVSFAFTNANKSVNIGYGNGWNVNYNSKVSYDNNLSKFYEIDYTGNKVYYHNISCAGEFVSSYPVSNACYVSEDGSQKTMVRQAAYGTFIGTNIYNGGDRYYFNTSGYLTSINSRKYSIAITIDRDSANWNKINYVKDSSNNFIRFNYDLNDRLTEILLRTNEIETSGTSTDYLEKIVFSYLYGTNKLNSVNYYSDYDQNHDATIDDTIYYSYDSYQRLYEGYLSGGEKIKYTYDASSTQDKISVIESFYNGIKFSEVTYEYGIKQTNITDHTGNFVMYKFDNYGHTVNMIDKNTNTVYYQYIDIFNNIAPDIYLNYYLNNTLINQSVPQKLTYNPIENYSFEIGSNNWTFYGIGSGSVTSTKSISGLNSYQISPNNYDGGYVKQNVILDEGVYTLRASVWNESGEDYVYIKANGVQSNLVVSKSEWQYISVPVIISSETATLSIELHSHVNGNVFFDNISIVDGINDTRVNIVDNASFENNGTVGWTLSSPSNTTYYSINDQESPVNSTFEDILGEFAVGITGSSTTSRSIYTTINKNYFENTLMSGGKLYIGGWANAYSSPKINNANIGEDKIFSIGVDFIYDSTIIKSQNVNFNHSIVDWQYIYGEIIVPSQVYDSIRISFKFKGEGEVIFDGMSVFYEADETSYEYDPFGRLIKTNKPDGTIYTYSYDSPEDIYPSSLTDENQNTVMIESDGSEVTYVTKNNIKATPTYNSNGQVTTMLVAGVTVGEPDNEYFSTSTTYMCNSQYVSSTSDEFENVTEYYTDELNGLLQYIENAQNVKTQYEYYDNGQLMKVYIGESLDSTTPYVKYVYDTYDRLVQIELDTNFYYNIHYDYLGRIDYVYINSNLLMSYSYVVDNYGYQTGIIEDQTYANGDKISFEYNVDNQISEIKFTGSLENEIVKFKYQYDSFGRISVYEDVTNGVSEYYEYDISGNLSKITDNHDNEIVYGYDDKGNLNSLNVTFGTLEQEIRYDYINPVNSDFYDRTWFNNGNNTIYKNYVYESSGLQRLDHIEYLNGSYHFMDYELSYQFNRTRISTITYNFYYSSDISYVYNYDSLGNITHEYYYEGTTPKFDKNYEYDDYNQLIVEDSRDYNETPTTLTDTNYTKFYYYDSNGNRTDVKTFLYGQNDYLNYTTPSFYENSSGTTNVKAYYNQTNDCYDIYELEIGETPTISISLYNLDLGTWITGLVIVDETYSNLNINKEGYYFSYFTASYKFSVYTEFRIVFKVGNPVNGPVIPQNHIHYNYGSSWKDQLIGYGEIEYINGIPQTEATIQQYTYDNQGNPTEITNFVYDGTIYNHAILSWDGRELSKISVYSTLGETSLVSEICYTYNDQGIRTTKTIDDGELIKYQYVLSGNTMLAEIVSVYNDTTENWDFSYQMSYSYDYDGSLIGFTYDNGTSKTDYLYIKNLQGDITKIITASGYTVVSYQYDAYGNITSISGDFADTIGEFNSFRYRSYKYDSEIKMYYLNSRYYNPEVGRFINADGLLGEMGNIQSTNMYAYCANNPVMYSDITGYSPKWVDTLAWIGVGLVVFGALVLTAGAAGFAIGGIAGAIINGAAIGALIGAGGGAIIGAFGGIINDAIVGNDFGTSIWTWTKAGFGIGAIMGFIVGGTVGGLSYTPSGLGKSAINQAVKTAISDTNKMSHIMLPKHGFGNSITQVANLMRNTLINGTVSIYGSAGAAGAAYVASWAAGGAQVTYVIIDGILRISDMFPF